MEAGPALTLTIKQSKGIQAGGGGSADTTATTQVMIKMDFISISVVFIYEQKSLPLS